MSAEVVIIALQNVGEHSRRPTSGDDEDDAWSGHLNYQDVTNR